MEKLRWSWEHLEEVLLCIIITIIVCISGLQVVFRYLFNNSLSWSEELCRYLFVWTGFLTISLSIRSRSIITIDAFVLFLSKRVRSALNVLVYMFCTVVFVILTQNAYHIVESTAGQLSPAMGLPLAVVYVGPLLGFALAAVRSVGRIFSELSALTGKEAA